MNIPQKKIDWNELYERYGEPMEPEDISSTNSCLDCGSTKFERIMQANGPDDYDWIYTCKECGSTYG